MSSIEAANRRREQLESGEPTGVDAAQVAAHLRTGIRERWFGTDAELAFTAGISTSGLTALKTKGVDRYTSSLGKVCRALGVNVHRLLEGELVFAESTAARRPDLHALLDVVVGSVDEATIERILRSLAETCRR